MKRLIPMYLTVICAAAFAAAPADQDRITVAAYIPITDGTITGFAATQHLSGTYVYAQRANGEPATLINVTKPETPQVVAAEVPASNYVALTGTAALTTDAPPVAAPPAQTLRIMDFSDPANPKEVRKFEGVTAVQRIAGGLIMLANPEGIYILSEHHQKPAARPK
ncbi:MAG TPA: hypothetical protein VG273_15685 [Bryobacteraceae bacterium]|nr:hypothetical protein [Bryobacteraceae bacterium]